LVHTTVATNLPEVVRRGLGERGVRERAGVTQNGGRGGGA